MLYNTWKLTYIISIMMLPYTVIREAGFTHMNDYGNTSRMFVIGLLNVFLLYMAKDNLAKEDE